MNDNNIQSFIINKSQLIFEKVKGYREFMHKYPELSYQEMNTMNFVSEKLTELGIPHQTQVGGTGVVGIPSQHYPTNPKDPGQPSYLSPLGRLIAD